MYWIISPISYDSKIRNVGLFNPTMSFRGIWNGLHCSYGILIPYEQYSIRTFCSLWEKISIILFLWNIYLYNILLSLFVRMEYLLFVCMEYLLFVRMEYLLFVRMEYSLFIYILLYDIINKCYCCY